MALCCALALALCTLSGCAHLGFSSENASCGCTGAEKCQCGENAENCPCPK